MMIVGRAAGGRLAAYGFAAGSDGAAERANSVSSRRRRRQPQP